MGLGGALIWSGLANDISHFRNKKTVFLYNGSTLQYLLKRQQSSDHIIYQNNPQIYGVYPKSYWKFKKFFMKEECEIVDQTDPGYFYWHKATEEKMFLKSDIHAIKIASMHHGLDDSLIQPRVFLKPEEEFKAQSLLDKYGLEHKKYICFEPNSNLEWTPNRRWIDHYWGEFLESMQDWFDRNNLEYKIVQIGDKNPRLRFYDTINLCGESSFRETAYILQKSSVFISTEGGLGHLATAAYARTLMIMSGYNPEALIKYPQNTNIYECVECFGCGLRTECPNDLKCMQLITPDKVLESIKNILTESKES